MESKLKPTCCCCGRDEATSSIVFSSVSRLIPLDLASLGLIATRNNSINHTQQSSLDVLERAITHTRSGAENFSVA